MDKMREDFKKELNRAGYLISKYGFKKALILEGIAFILFLAGASMVVLLAYLLFEALVL